VAGQARIHDRRFCLPWSQVHILTMSEATAKQGCEGQMAFPSLLSRHQLAAI
jgi:hypothetical protein